MTNTSLDLSNKLPAQTLETLRSIKAIADNLKIPVLLVGATARDLILQYGYEIQGRFTRDIDFGVAVHSWEEYGKLKAKLVEEKFTLDSKIEHRFIEISTKTPIDFVPFGGIESPRGKITLQNENTMTTSGFIEAFDSALNVKLADDFTIKVVSPVGLVLLKLTAWLDRQLNKDTEDFWLVTKNYLYLGNEEKLYTDMDLLNDDNFDFVMAGARILGRDLKLLFNEQTEKIILSIFDDQKKLQKLAIEIYRKEGRLDDNLDQITTILESMKIGLKE